MTSRMAPLLVLALLVAAAHAGYLSPYHALPPPLVSYGYHTAVVSKPLLHPLPVLPPPVIVKPIATSYQSFHKIDRPAIYPIHYVKPIAVPVPLHPLPLPLAYGHHYPHYLH